MTYRDPYESQDYPRITPAVQWLIAINVAVAFVQIVVVRGSLVPETLGFSSEAQVLTRWWTVVTYMFVHGGVMHLAVNMFSLWMFGPRIEHEWGTKPFVRYYLWCGLGGLVLHAVAQPAHGLIGASAAVFGVMLAYAVRWPDDEVLFFGVIPMKVKWLVGGLVTLNLMSGVLAYEGGAAGGGVAYFAHLGGVLFGWLYLRTSPLQSIERLRQRISPAPDIPEDEAPRAIPRSLPRGRERQREGEVDEIVAQSKAVAAQRPVMAAQRAESSRERQVETLNLLLDKISQGGMSSLTADERRTLEEVSRGLRKDV